MRPNAALAQRMHVSAELAESLARAAVGLCDNPQDPDVIGWFDG